MTRKSVVSGLLPAALGPYTHAIVAGGFVFSPGTTGIDPAAGTVRDGIEAQTEQALRNLAAILQAAGPSTADLVKTTIFYTNTDDFPKISKVYAQHMPDPAGAPGAGERRTALQLCSARISERHMIANHM